MLPMFTSMRDFDSWLASFRPSIADYKYYTDFNKVFNNVDAIKIPLNILTYIIHSGFISGYQNRYGDNLKPPTNVYHRMTA